MPRSWPRVLTGWNFSATAVNRNNIHFILIVPESISIHLLDAVFRAKRGIKSLPPLHGARWSAWLRFACKNIGIALDAAVLGLLPLRNGQNPIAEGEIVALRLITDGNGLASLRPLMSAMASVSPRGEFSSHTLEFLFWKDVVGQQNFARDAPLEESEPVPLAIGSFGGEIEKLMGLNAFTLVFNTPLRLKLPPGSERKGGERMRFCQSDFFADGGAINYLCEKIRFLNPVGCPGTLKLVGHNLRWYDMRYNESRHIALGGLMGKIACSGALDRETATRLVLGQYLGAGKNPLFGLGYWRIPEIS